MPIIETEEEVGQIETCPFCKHAFIFIGKKQRVRDYLAHRQFTLDFHSHLTREAIEYEGELNNINKHITRMLNDIEEIGDNKMGDNFNGV